MSIVSGWKSTAIVSGVPQRVQNCRRPKSVGHVVPIASAPASITKSSTGTLLNTIAGAPLIRWQLRQWHQPVSNGSLVSR